MLRPDPDAPRPLHERGMPDVTDAPVQFLCQPELMIAYEFTALLPGREQTSADWIPPGSYIARIESRDFMPVETKVKIQLGEVTNLRVPLTAR